MAIDEKVATYVRAALAAATGVSEVKMFGGIGFMLNGNMVAAASDRGLLLRVGAAAMPEALDRGAEPMVMNGRTMKDYARVIEDLDSQSVQRWVQLACIFVETLPPKDAKNSGPKPAKSTAATRPNATAATRPKTSRSKK